MRSVKKISDNITDGIEGSGGVFGCSPFCLSACLKLRFLIDFQPGDQMWATYNFSSGRGVYDVKGFDGESLPFAFV